MFGARELWRRNRQAAYLAACVVAVPSAAMLAARPAKRRLTRDAPLDLRAAVLRARAGARRPRARAEVRARSRSSRSPCSSSRSSAGLYEKTPQLFTGDPSSRVAARNGALAGVDDEDDDVFGYEPVYLEARERNSGVARNVIRADAKLAAARLGLREPLGRGVRVFDAYDTNNCKCSRTLTIEERVAASARRLRGARVRSAPRDPHARADANAGGVPTAPPR